MKKILIVLLSIYLISPMHSFGFEHERQMPSTVATEKWAFNKDEVRDILIEYLKSKGYEIRNKKPGRITIKEGLFPDKIITLWIEYDVANDANKRAVQPLNNPLVVK